MSVVIAPGSTLADELSRFIKSKPSHVTDTDTFTKEEGHFIVSRKMTTDLENLHRAFLVIPPTSVEAKRVFSAAGLFLLKLRTKMGDQTLDKLKYF